VESKVDLGHKNVPKYIHVSFETKWIFSEARDALYIMPWLGEEGRGVSISRRLTV